MTPTKFEWQNEYMAVGVGFEQLEAVRKYIATSYFGVWLLPYI